MPVFAMVLRSEDAAMRCLLAGIALLLFGCPAVEDAVPPPCVEENTEAGEFQAGVAEIRMPVPLGIGTSGNGGIGGPDSPSPYARRYPGTTRIHGHPTFKAIALSRGVGHELILVRSDMIAVVQQLRDAAVAEVHERIGRDLDDALMIGATHTHSGPGRFIEGSLFAIIADDFLPAFYDRLVNALADVIIAALDDLGPAEFGYVMASAPEAHSDRRCEDLEDYTNDTTPLIAVSKGGEVVGLVVSYAIHGTVIGIDDLTLSADASGAIEAGVEDSFDHPVTVMMLNSWAADVSPGSPELPAVPEASPQASHMERLERLGAYMGEVVQDALGTMQTTAEPVIESRTVRYPINRAAMGYQGTEFDYEFGAIYCSSAWDSCEELMVLEDLDEACIPMPESSPAPMQSMFTMGRLDGLHFSTWSGEAGTHLAEGLIENMQAEEGVGDVVFFGYGNDYVGYALEEDDWWHGGYEASGAFWGPKQGEYMRDVQQEAFRLRHEPVCGELSFVEPAPAPLFVVPPDSAWVVEEALDFGVVSVQPEPTYAPGAVARFTVQGSEPWLGAPLARLQRADGEDWADVRRPGGKNLDSDGYGYWVDLATEPSWQETTETTARVFSWTVSLKVTGRGWAAEPGTYRFAVELPTESGVEEVVTDAFEVTGT